MALHMVQLSADEQDMQLELQLEQVLEPPSEKRPLAHSSHTNPEELEALWVEGW